MEFVQKFREWIWTITVCYFITLTLSLCFAFAWQYYIYGFEGWCLYFIQTYVVWYILSISLSYFSITIFWLYVSSIKLRRSFKLTKT